MDSTNEAEASNGGKESGAVLADVGFVADVVP